MAGATAQPAGVAALIHRALPGVEPRSDGELAAIRWSLGDECVWTTFQEDRLVGLSSVPPGHDTTQVLHAAVSPRAWVDVMLSGRLPVDHESVSFETALGEWTHLMPVLSELRSLPAGALHPRLDLAIDATLTGVGAIPQRYGVIFRGGNLVFVGAGPCPSSDAPTFAVEVDHSIFFGCFAGVRAYEDLFIAGEVQASLGALSYGIYVMSDEAVHAAFHPVGAMLQIAGRAREFSTPAVHRSLRVALRSIRLSRVRVQP